MQSRGHASPDDIDMASVFRTLKRSARWLIAISLVLGGLTYGALVMSNVHLASAPIFAHRIGLSALVTMVSLMFGTAWVLGKALFREARRGSRTITTSQEEKPVRLRPEPAFPPYHETLLREVTDNDVFTPPSQATAVPEPQPQRPSSGAVAVASDVGALVLRLMQRRPETGGHRTILTGESESIDASREALALVKALGQSGEQVILIDWDPDGQNLTSAIGLNPSAGLNDLLRGDVSFGDVIQRIPGSDGHVIASGSPIDHALEATDPDRLNLVLDALDEAYDYIVVTGRHDAARDLFETIEGRFDTGIVVGELRHQPAVDPEDMFLGFEVAGIDIVRFERRVSQTSPMQQRIARATDRRVVDVARRA